MMKILWQELDHHPCIETKVSLKNALILKNHIKKDKVYEFLVSLNAKFEQVKSSNTKQRAHNFE